MTTNTDTITDPNATYDSNQMGTNPAGQSAGYESNLSNWVGPYVTNMLGRGQALSNNPYVAYSGPLTAGTNALQDQAATGIAGLATPTGMGTGYDSQNWTILTTDQQQAYINPYVRNVLDDRMANLSRQQDLDRLKMDEKLTKAGAFGGSRQAVQDALLQENYLRQKDQSYNEGLMNAYTSGLGQFNTEENRRRQAIGERDKYGMDVLGAQMTTGDTLRGIESEGIEADMEQFYDEQQYPYDQVRYMYELLNGLPLQAQQQTYQQPSQYQQMATGASTAGSLMDTLFGLYDKFSTRIGDSTTTTTPTGGTS